MKTSLTDELLLKVQKPARYIGGEWNAVKKDWADDLVKVLLAFPDAYEVGMSYLGLKILYGILNKRDDCLCERTFAPWPDLEDILRRNRISLFSLESRRPIREFDVIGFSLTYELNYTNVLNMLDLGGIPKRSSERSDADPLVIAGGPSCYNPEPMADFIDAFIIGEAEEAILELVDAYKGLRVKLVRRSPKGEGGGKGLRETLLKELAKIKGIYVPSLYKVEYNPDNTIKEFTPTEKEAAPKIEKRVVRDFEGSFYPTAQIVPYIQVVHDRIVLEIMRGCKHACSFCQAGATYRPWRERSKGKILELAQETYKMTGYEEISLLSLSTADHSHVKEIIEDLNKVFKDKAVSISLPSLRIEDVLKILPILLSQVKKTGLTFAPEAGSASLRRVINKNIDIEKLFEAAIESFRLGWKRLKLYFMIGLPTEKDDDISSMADLIHKVSNLKKPIDGSPAYVTASINAFVPKPHTPLQCEAMLDMEGLFKKKDLLKGLAKSRWIKLDFHSFKMSYLEAIFSRGDRSLSEAIYEAWSSGARFDGWQDLFDFDIWLESFQKTGIDPRFYAERVRARDEISPWDFIVI